MRIWDMNFQSYHLVFGRAPFARAFWLCVQGTHLWKIAVNARNDQNSWKSGLWIVIVCSLWGSKDLLNIINQFSIKHVQSQTKNVRFQWEKNCDYDRFFLNISGIMYIKTMKMRMPCLQTIPGTIMLFLTWKSIFQLCPWGPKAALSLNQFWAKLVWVFELFMTVA